MTAAFRAMRVVATRIGEVLGTQHPHSLTAVVNLALAGFELARSGDTELAPESALKTLETAYERANALLGHQHSITRVLFHELSLCRQWVYGRDEHHDGSGGEGTVQTRQRTETTSAFRYAEPFDQEYLSIERAALMLRSRTVVAEKVPRPHDLPEPDGSALDSPPVTPQCCGDTPKPFRPSSGEFEHDPNCPNHPDNLPPTR